MREKELPELDDDFASEASEFETIAELRDEMRRRLSEGLERQAEAEFREAAVDVVAANAKLEIPHDLVHARAHEMWERIEQQLASRGIDPQMYAQMQGKARHDLIDDAEEDAERALRREAVLAAVADAEGIEPSDDDLIEALGPGEGKNDPREAARAPARERPRSAAARRGPDAHGGRRRRRVGEADHDGARRRTQADLDARQGAAGVRGRAARGRGQARRALDAW